MNVPSLISIGVRLECAGINHSLVVHQAVIFFFWIRVQLIGLRVPYDVVGFVDGGLTWFQEGLLDFIQDILTHDAIIQLGFALTVETKTSNLALHLAFLCGVTIILGTP